MRSYFVRHTDDLRVRDEDLKQLWEENRIAVHYPDEASGLGDEDSRSTNPERYAGSGKTAMRYLNELCENGGYVWAESFVAEGGVAKVGRVESGSEIQVVQATWHLRGRPYDGRRDGQPAFLKIIRPEDVTPVKRGESNGLRAGRPRGGTIVRWRKCGTRLEDLVEGRPPREEWANLSTEEQEAVCAEFLRYPPKDWDSPPLRYLLVPVGRTLQDVDIHGLDATGEEIFAQVTYASEGTKEVNEKANKLRRYGQRSTETQLVLFCQCGTGYERDRVRFVPVEEVMSWTEAHPRYRSTLFRRTVA